PGENTAPLPSPALHEQRERWIEAMHRSPEGVSWRVQANRNRESERLRRAALVARRQAASDLASHARSQGRVLRSTLSIAPTSVQARPSLSEAGGEEAIPTVGYWEEVGSRNQAGHTRSAVLGPEVMGVSQLYVGSAEGGIWRSPNLGTDWSPISDNVFGGGDEVVVLTPMPGETDDVVVFRSGERIYRSEDGGVSWGVPQGFNNLLEFLTLQRLYDGQETLLALVRQSGGLGSETWLYRSQDKGLTFQPLWQSPQEGRGDLWTPQTGPGAGLEVHLALNGGLLRSTDGGASFQAGPTLVPGSGQAHISGSEDGGLTLYAVFRSGIQWLLYRSDDAGTSALPLGGLSDYSGNPRSLVGFPGDAQTVVYGGINAYRSNDGGQTFTPINQWSEYYNDPASKLHGDIRGMDVQVRDNMGTPQDWLFFNTDGGSYLSLDRGGTVSNLSLQGLGVGQVYSTLTSVVDPRRIAGGTQDQGYQLGVREPYFRRGPSTAFDQYISGDYGHLVSGDGSHSYVYGVYPGIVSSANPGFVVVQQGEVSPTLTTVPFPPAGNSSYMPPLVADPTDVESFYLLANRLWRATKNGATWSFVQHSTQDFSQGAGAYLASMAIAPSDPTRMYAASDGGTLWWSIDAGVTWTLASDPGPSSQYFYGSAMLVDPIDPLMAIAAGNGYSGPGVRITYDGGDHWQDLGQDMPITLFLDLAWSPNGNGDIFAATESGAYRYIAATNKWQNIMGLEAPSTTYWSVETVAASQRVRFGTFGRGIWDFVLALPLRSMGDAYCDPAIPNSTLVPGQLEILGTPLALATQAELHAFDLPPGEFGYFMISDTQSAPVVPFWSDGYLCIDSTFSAFGFQNTDPTGSMSLTLDLTQLPSTPVQSVLAGQTWFFQAWHTDYVMIPTGNFTNAVGVYFH
ncbi:MAG TPA: hypothetical protein P5218_05860, partial [Planctomycetota bacterium]|nr:hypothetical protein [Planctomycetota bacterium]